MAIGPRPRHARTHGLLYFPLSLSLPPSSARLLSLYLPPSLSLATSARPPTPRSRPLSSRGGDYSALSQSSVGARCARIAHVRYKESVYLYIYLQTYRSGAVQKERERLLSLSLSLSRTRDFRRPVSRSLTRAHIALSLSRLPDVYRSFACSLVCIVQRERERESVSKYYLSAATAAL